MDNKSRVSKLEQTREDSLLHIRFKIIQKLNLCIIIKMVFITYKKTEKNSFAIECSIDSKVASILAVLVQFNNLRVYLDRLIWSIEELANKGVLKPSELQGVSWDDYQKHQKEFHDLPLEMKQYGKKPEVQPPFRYVADKHNQRYGVVVPETERQAMLTAAANAKQVLQFKGEIIQKEKLVEAVERLRTSVMEAYPGYIDLPQWQPALLMLQQKIDIQILQTESFQVFDERSTLWWAGKQLDSAKAIGQYVGKNEKTKVIVKVQKWGGQQPLREPPVDPQTYQKMVKYYYKKVEQTKQLEKKSVETHFEKVESKDMKAQVHLQEEIRFKPF